MSLVELPRHSPDLNPIENLWADLNRRLESHHIQTIEEFRDIIPLEWKKTTALTCSNLVDSMPDRMRVVVTAEGFKTRYYQGTVVISSLVFHVIEIDKVRNTITFVHGCIYGHRIQKQFSSPR